MFKLAFILILLIITFCKLANLASIITTRRPAAQGAHHMGILKLPLEFTATSNKLPTTAAMTDNNFMITTNKQAVTPPVVNTQPSATIATRPISSLDLTTITGNPTITTTATTTTTLDPNNFDLDDPMHNPNPSNNEPNQPGGAGAGGSVDNNGKPNDENKHNGTDGSLDAADLQASKLKDIKIEWSILFYSLFIVFVSFVKLLYHNVNWIKHNMTEPGILMISGIVWELIVRQISSDYDTFPRFKAKIFFYLFLPSTVLESASLLSNKWLFFNALPILTHSIVGTILFAVSFGLTIFSMSQADLFAINNSHQQYLLSTNKVNNSKVPMNISSPLHTDNGPIHQLLTLTAAANSGGLPLPPVVVPSSNQLNLAHQYQQNINMSDCFIFGTILASIDASPMLNLFRYYQVNEKLYYLVLGESLMNNAVVIILFNLLLEYFEATEFTAFGVYFAILQFFATLFGGILIGITLAAFALVCVRLTRRFQVPDILSSYQNQCQAMVETLLILKLAYLTYTLANLAGTSGIVGLATFGILNDQYIKQNLNLRSQLTFRQVILATKTMGFSLVYPLLGMLLVEVAGNNQLYHQFDSKIQSAESRTSHQDIYNGSSSLLSLEAQASTSSQHQHHNQQVAAGQQWDFKFLSAVIILTITYRFVIVICLGVMSNVLTCGQLEIKFKELILMAYGGLKGPLAIALVHKLLDHEDHKQRMAHNRHLYIYTILSVTLVSIVLVGSFLRPLVARVQLSLIAASSSNVSHHHMLTSANQQTSFNNHDDKQHTTDLNRRLPTILFDHINHKLTEYTSQGLNSILGHSRSPYDKFAEFNEVHVKPWLAKSGTNTNWLSVFYDNLILDETLNANCFYVATEDPTTLRTLFATSQQFEHLNLDENFQLVRPDKETVAKVGDAQHHMPMQMGTKGPVAGVSTGADGRFSSILSKIQGEDYGNALLKEFVLLNLKLENSRKRKRQIRDTRMVPNNYDKSLDIQEEATNKRALISSTNSSLNSILGDSSGKRLHLERLVKTTYAGESAGENSGTANNQQQQQGQARQLMRDKNRTRTHRPRRKLKPTARTNGGDIGKRQLQ